MILVVDKEGQQALELLADSYLKAGGIGGLQNTLAILQSVQTVEQYTEKVRVSILEENKEPDKDPQ